MTNQINKLNKKIRKLYPRVIRGTVIKTTRTCGKPNCHCRTGKKHIIYYIALQLKNKLKAFYIKKKTFKKALMWSRNYQKVKSITEKLTLLNINSLQKE